jgi:hypothetical protein
VYWFHKDLKEKVPQEKIKIRFKKLESLDISQLKKIENFDSQQMAAIGKKRKIFYFGFLGIFLMMLLELFINFRKDENTISNEQEINSRKADLISSVASYQSIPIKKDYFSSGKFKNSFNLPDSIEKPENEVERHLLENVLIKIIDLLSVPFFKKGIVLDLEINEEVTIFAPLEILEQTFYSFFTYFINSFSDDIEHKKIYFKTKILGNTAILEIQTNGQSFNEDFLKMANGLTIQSKDDNGAANLRVACGLLKEINGDVLFENSDLGPMIKIQLKSEKVKSTAIKKSLKRNLGPELVA